MDEESGSDREKEQKRTRLYTACKDNECADFKSGNNLFYNKIDLSETNVVKTKQLSVCLHATIVFFLVCGSWDSCFLHNLFRWPVNEKSNEQKNVILEIKMQNTCYSIRILKKSKNSSLIKQTPVWTIDFIKHEILTKISPYLRIRFISCFCSYKYKFVVSDACPCMQCSHLKYRI